MPPKTYPALLKPIDDGYDIASGWRHERADNALTRRLPSKIANWMMAKASGMDLRDFGTTFKAYRAEVLEDVHLNGELNRCIPPLASFDGARLVEEPIQNPHRGVGDSHYGLSRTLRVLFDILNIRFLLKYATRPMHFFGAIGLAGSSACSLILGFCLLVKIFTQIDIIQEHGPLMLAGAMLLIVGVMMFSTGLIGELVMRTYFESQDRRIYAVRDILTQQPRAQQPH